MVHAAMSLVRFCLIGGMGCWQGIPIAMLLFVWFLLVLVWLLAGSGMEDIHPTLLGARAQYFWILREHLDAEWDIVETIE